MDYRIIFSKTGNARYISHLDLNRCMQRAIRRCGLPAWYTEGFHPHMYLMFPLALSLGAESVCEAMDVRLTEELTGEEVLERLNAVLPEGLYVHHIHTPRDAAVSIGSAVYRVSLRMEEPEILFSCWNDFLAEEQILMEKTNRKGTKLVDIRPMLQPMKCRVLPDGLEIVLRLPAGNTSNLNVSAVMDTFQKQAKQPFQTVSTVREKIFCLNGEEFF